MLDINHVAKTMLFLRHMEGLYHEIEQAFKGSPPNVFIGPAYRHTVAGRGLISFCLDSRLKPATDKYSVIPQGISSREVVLAEGECGNDKIHFGSLLAQG
ncbi:MAG: hypothetical protein Q8Q33_06930 [Chlamydiota bacterium]|nr:hypothetical protein [Chlamydiota bacterium]